MQTDRAELSRILSRLTPLTLLSFPDLLVKLKSSLHRRGFVGTIGNCVGRIEGIFFDLTNHVDTGSIWTDSVANGAPLKYSPTKLSTFRDIISHLNLPYPEFTFLDVGAGKGRILLLASELPFKRVVGIESSPALHATALKNIRNYHSHRRASCPIDCILADALDYSLPNENMVVFLFNPFGRATFTRFASKLRQSLREAPRHVYVVYNNPIFRDVLDRTMELVDMRRNYCVFRNRKMSNTADADWSLKEIDILMPSMSQ